MGIKSEVIMSVMLSHSLLLLVLVTAGQAAPSQGVPKINRIRKGNGSPLPLTLDHLGTVDGRDFFVEPNVTMNWTDAKAFCEAPGLKLGRIESQNVTDFLIEALQPYGIEIDYWMGARETGSLSMIRYEVTGQTPNIQYFKSGGRYGPIYQICGAFYLINFNLGFSIRSCPTLKHFICMTP